MRCKTTKALLEAIAAEFVALCSVLPSTILEDSGSGFHAPTNCDTHIFPLPSSQIRQGNWFGQAAPKCDGDAETSLLWSTRSNTRVCHNSHDDRRRLEESLGPLPFVTCGDERASLRVGDLRFQHKREDNLADARRVCTNSQDGHWISADSISKHSLNPSGECRV